MANEPKAKFIPTKSGKVHVFRSAKWDAENSKCAVVKRSLDEWAGKKGISPEAALDLDPCEKCATSVVAKRVIEAAKTPDQKRAESRDRSAATVRKATETDAQRKRREGKEAKAAIAKAKTEKKVADRGEAVGARSRLVESRKTTMTKSGPRSVASAKDGDPGKQKAMMLIEFGNEHGWASALEEDGKTGWVVESVKDVDGVNEVIHTWYVDGKYDINHHAEISVGSWVGKLRGAHGVRRQMAGVGRDRPFPNPGSGRSSGGKSDRASLKEESVEEPDIEKEHAGLPFDIWESDEALILDSVRGKTLRWRNSLNQQLMEATVPTNSKYTKVTVHPKREARILEFIEVVDFDIAHGGEVLGGIRSVALDRLVRVKDAPSRLRSA